MRIPFAKPWIPDASKKHVAEAMETGRIGRSDYYAAQCREHLQDLVNREFILLVNSGTMALQCALAARPEWDTVRVPDYTFGATANAVLLTGRKLVLAELLPKTHSIHVAVHGELEEPAALIDSAQAFPGEWGASEDITGSFFINKAVTSGEGGYYATNDPDRYLLAKGYMDHGRMASGFGQTIPGASGHMPDLNAALLLGQLECWSEREADTMRQAKTWETEKSRKPFYLTTHAGWCVITDNLAKSYQTKLVRELRRAGIDARRDFRPLRTLRAFRDVPTEGEAKASYAVLLPAWHGIPDEAIHEMQELCKST